MTIVTAAPGGPNPPLSFTAIEDEFGSTSTRSLGSYRSSDSNFLNKNIGSLSNLPLDNHIPIDGEIKFSDFLGKKLNLVVDYYSGGTEIKQTVGALPMSAVWRYAYQPSKVKVVGGFRTRPDLNTWQNGKRVIVNVNKTIGGNKDGDAHDVALRTGVWPGGTELQVEIGTNGKILGAGGDGGNPSTSNIGVNGSPGGNGTSALGVEYPAVINNNGILRCGFGGGGGGSGAATDPNDNQTDFGRSGSGGGGGAGLPAGVGGSASLNLSFNPNGNEDTATGQSYNGKAGNPGTEDAGGTSGAITEYAYPNMVLNPDGSGNAYLNQDGGSCTLTNVNQITPTSYCGLVVRGGKGGNGGDAVDPAQPGLTAIRYARGYGTPGSGGAAGNNGKSIRYVTPSVRDDSTLIGSEVGGTSVVDVPGAMN